MTPAEIYKLTTPELRAILLTVDGKGKPIKEIALGELLGREYDDGFNDGKAIEADA